MKPNEIFRLAFLDLPTNNSEWLYNSKYQPRFEEKNDTEISPFCLENVDKETVYTLKEHSSHIVQSTINCLLLQIILTKAQVKIFSEALFT